MIQKGDRRDDSYAGGKHSDGIDIGDGVMEATTDRTPRFPDFLGIGAQRGGSSWLYRVLSHHPRVWMPPVKEIHYFDRPREGERVFAYWGKQGLVRLRDYLSGETFETTGDGLWTNLRWDTHYLFGRRGPEWYVKLFRPHEEQITGEITPAYGTLNEERVRAIRANNRDLKALLILRDPIARAWSSVVNNLGKKMRRNIASVSLDEIYARIDTPGFRLRCDYARMIRMWRSVLGEDRLFVGYMEEIKANPEDLFDRICDFLNIERASSVVLPHLSTGVNTTAKFSAPMPREVRRHLARSLMPMIDDAATLLGGYAERWAADARSVQDDHGTTSSS